MIAKESVPELVWADLPRKEGQLPLERGMVRESLQHRMKKRKGSPRRSEGFPLKQLSASRPERPSSLWPDGPR